MFINEKLDYVYISQINTLSQNKETAMTTLLIYKSRKYLMQKYRKMSCETSCLT